MELRKIASSNKNNRLYHLMQLKCWFVSLKAYFFDKRNKTSIEHTLLKIAPNPFVQVTTINLVLPKAQIISLNLYNTAGGLLKKIVLNQSFSKGQHQFNLDKTDFKDSGLYFLEVLTSETMITRKLMLLE